MKEQIYEKYWIENHFNVDLKKFSFQVIRSVING